MISYKELQKKAMARLKDANVLKDERRYEGAAYLCGYAVELALKAIICKDLSLSGIPSTAAEFNRIRSIKTHNLENLLGITPQKIREDIKLNYLSEWSTVINNWEPEMRYNIIRIGKTKTENIIDSTKKMLRYFWRNL
ncbi:MAG: HEPN domain-containing protein [Candidatus Nealsonbacteria bacterium]